MLPVFACVVLVALASSAACDAECRRATLIGTNLPNYLDRVLSWNSTDLTRNRARDVHCGTADQNRYHGAANSEPQELH